VGIWFEQNVTPSSTSGSYGPDIVLNRSAAGSTNQNTVTLYANRVMGTISITNDGPPNAYRIALVFRPTTDTVAYQPYSAKENRGLAPQQAYWKKIDPNKGNDEAVDWTKIGRADDYVLDYKHMLASPGDSNPGGNLPKGKYYVCAVTYNEPAGDYAAAAGTYAINKALAAYGYKRNVWLYLDTEHSEFMGKVPRLYLSAGNPSAPDAAIGSDNLYLRAFKQNNTNIKLDYPQSGNLKAIVFRPVPAGTTAAADIGKFPTILTDGSKDWSIAQVGPATLNTADAELRADDLVFHANLNYEAWHQTGWNIFYLPPGKYYAYVIDGNNKKRGYTDTEWLFVDTAYLNQLASTQEFFFYAGLQNTGTRAQPVLRVMKHTDASFTF
jgi:hypothetical protein